MHAFRAEAKIETSLNKLQSKMEGKRERIEQEEALNSILISGLDYVGTTKAGKCPLCKSEIECAKVLTELQKEIDQRESARLMRQIQDELAELDKEKITHENALSELHACITTRILIKQLRRVDSGVGLCFLYSSMPISLTPESWSISSTPDQKRFIRVFGEKVYPYLRETYKAV